MVVKVVTDSTSDISPEVAHALGITIVPAYVRFGDEVYRDGVDISNAEFYHKLVTSPVHPATSQPPQQDFAVVYSGCSKEAEAIISIHVTAKASGTCNSALQGGKMTEGRCRIEVVDSRLTSVGLGMVVMAAARLARAGGNLQSVLEETRRAISQVRMLGVFDTVKYLVRGGRVSKAVGVVASILDIKPLLTFKDGEIVRAGLVRTNSGGMDRLYEFVENTPTIQELAVAYSTVPEQASRLKARLAPIFPEEKISVTQLGAALGAHGGPGALILAIRRGD
jgi:DegV family protein with EDD domain